MRRAQQGDQGHFLTIQFSIWRYLAVVLSLHAAGAPEIAFSRFVVS
ncbi:MAG: hypothetical protein ACI89J_000313 [Hyphomicrobiaceae bacterium]|jgi:hypothetical protein